MCHGAVIPKIVSNSFVSCNGAPPRSGCISRTRRLQPAAEQAAHPLQRPAQAASRITQIPCDPWRFRKDQKYEDLDGQALVELRCAKSDGTVGFQTMIPPSIHPSGEEIQFQSQGAIAHDDHLDRHVLLYAITCLFAKHLGLRDLNHEVRLAFAGFLFNEGFSPEEVIPCRFSKPRDPILTTFSKPFPPLD